MRIVRVLLGVAAIVAGALVLGGVGSTPRLLALAVMALGVAVVL